MADKLERYLIAMMGLFCSTGAVFVIFLGNTSLALINIVYIAYFIYGISVNRKGIKSCCVKVSKSRTLEYLFFSYICTRILITAITELTQRTTRALVLTFKISIVMILIGAIYKKKRSQEDKNNIFFKYLYFNCILQMVWSWFERFLYMAFRFKLNDFVFGQIIGIKSNHALTFVEYGKIRPSGFCWEPANLAFVLIMGYILAEKKYQKILFTISMVLTTSSTGMFMLIVIILYEIVGKMRSRKMLLKRTTLLIIPIILIVLIFAAYFVESKTGMLTFYLNKFIYIFNSASGTDSNAAAHMSYYKIYIERLSEMNLGQMLFGDGTFMAGHTLSSNGFFVQRINNFWNPETDVITLLLGDGIVGTILYYGMLLSAIRKNRQNIYAKKMVIALMVGGITYLYLASTWPLLIVMILYSNPMKNKNNPIKTDNLYISVDV